MIRFICSDFYTLHSRKFHLPIESRPLLRSEILCRISVTKRAHFSAPIFRFPIFPNLIPPFSYAGISAGTVLDSGIGEGNFYGDHHSDIAMSERLLKTPV